MLRRWLGAASRLLEPWGSSGLTCSTSAGGRSSLPQAVLNHCLWTGGLHSSHVRLPTAVGSGQLLWFPQASGSVNAFRFIYSQVRSSPWLWSYPANAGAGLSFGKVQKYLEWGLANIWRHHSTYCQGTLGFIYWHVLVLIRSIYGAFFPFGDLCCCCAEDQMYFIIFQFPFSVHPLSSCSPVILLPHTLKDGLSRTWQDR